MASMRVALVEHSGQAAFNPLGSAALGRRSGVAVDSGHIYWADQGGGGITSGTIMEANLNGTGVTTLVKGRTPRPGWRWTPATSTGPTSSASRSMRPS